MAELSLAERVEATVKSIDQALDILESNPTTVNGPEVEELVQIRNELTFARDSGDYQGLEASLASLAHVTRRLLGGVDS